MQLTNLQVEHALESLNVLLQKELPFKVSFILSKNKKALAEVYEIISQERNKIVDSFTVKDKKGKPTPVKDENGNILPNRVNISDPAQLNVALSELYAITTEVNIKQINIDDLEKIDVSGNIAEYLDFMITISE